MQGAKRDMSGKGRHQEMDFKFWCSGCERKFPYERLHLEQDQVSEEVKREAAQEQLEHVRLGEEDL